MRMSVRRLRVAREHVLTNAEDLVADAQLLLKNKRYARAFSLSVLAIEELAKTMALWMTEGSVRAGQPVDWKKLWSDLKRHNPKLEVAWGIREMLIQLPRLIESAEAYERAVLRKAKAITRGAAESNTEKQNGFYVSLSSRTILTPRTAISPKDAENRVAMALAGCKFLRIVLERFPTPPSANKAPPDLPVDNTLA